jgi:HPr kinase/phosphorylase
MTEYVTVKELSDNLDIHIVTGKEVMDKKIYTSDISRPGLELTGYFSYFSHDRVQLFGMKEISFMRRMIPEERLIVMRKICQTDTPAIVVSRNLEIFEEMIVAAREKGIPIFQSKIATSRLSGGISSFLDDRLADRQSVHGVLVDIYGLGVLIQGDSGIGKSETGLELIKRGHRLIADDRVDVYQKDELTVIGEAPPILEHLLEIRGVGIIDVMNLFGASAVRDKMQVQLAIYLEMFSKEKKYDRLGNGMDVVEIANVGIPQIRIPVKTGRNLSIIIEAAAMNFRAKNMGYDATVMFEERLSNLIESNSGE